VRFILNHTSCAFAPLGNTWSNPDPLNTTELFSGGVVNSTLLVFKSVPFHAYHDSSAVPLTGSHRSEVTSTSSVWFSGVQNGLMTTGEKIEARP
jgi:hypothetical protein